MSDEQSSGGNVTMHTAQHLPFDSGMLALRLDNSAELYQIECFFRASVLNNDNGEWVQIKNRKPLMNEEGVNRLMGLLSSHSNKVMSLSNFEKIEVDDFTFDADVAIILFLGLEYRKYGIDIGDRDIIRVICSNFIKASGKRPQNDNERRWIAGQVSSSETKVVSDANTQQSRGGIGSLFGGRN